MKRTMCRNIIKTLSCFAIALFSIICVSITDMKIYANEPIHSGIYNLGDFVYADKSGLSATILMPEAENNIVDVPIGTYHNTSVSFKAKVLSRTNSDIDLRLYSGEKEVLKISDSTTDVKWISTDSKIVCVDSNGNITALNPGIAAIIAQVGSWSQYWKVEVLSNKIKFNNLEMYSGEEIINFVEGCNDVKWKSSDKKIATVQDGKITALKPGIAYITAEVGAQVLECKVIINSSSLSNDSIIATKGQKIKINIIGSKAKPQYSSSDSGVVAIKNGNLVAVSSGKATIIVKLGDEKLKCKVKVGKLDAPTGITYTSETNKISLAWNSVENAKSYSVYMYDSEKKEYIFLEQTKKTTYTVKKLNPDTVYYFKIAVNAKENGVVTEQKLSKKIECRTIKDISGWITENGKKYYYKNGHSIGKGLTKIKGQLYIFEDDGSLITDRFTYIGSNYYYSDTNGQVACNKEVTDKESGTVYMANGSGVLSVKPFIPKLNDTSAYKVINSYRYTSSDEKYEYLVYVVEAKKTIDVDLVLYIKDKKGNIYDYGTDSISLTKGKNNVFILRVRNGYINNSYLYSFSEYSYESIWAGDTDAVEAVHYNTGGSRIYIELKQKKKNLGKYAKIKVLLFSDGKLFYATEYYYSIYAPNLTHIGAKDEIEEKILPYFNSIEFYFEDR